MEHDVLRALSRTKSKTKGTLFAPSDANALREYYFDVGVTDAGSGKVSNWADQSSNAIDLSQGTGANRPTLTAGGITFNGTSEYLFNTTPFLYDLPNGFHIFAVMSAPANTSGAAHYTLTEASTLSTNPNLSFLCIDNIVADYGKITQTMRNDAGTTLLTYGGNTGTTNAWDNSTKIIEHIDTTTQIATTINGVAEDSPLSYSRSGTLTLDRFSLGALVRATVLFYTEMTVKALVITSGDISTADTKKIQGYLYHNYGGSLPINHPYKWYPPYAT